MKKRAYEVRIQNVEHMYLFFTPLVFAATRGMGHKATTFYKIFASLLSGKWKEHYAVVLGWIRCRLSFCLLRSAIRCIQGARSSEGHYITFDPFDLIQSEARIRSIPYSGKFFKGLIFENFESSLAFSKIFFSKSIKLAIMHTHFRNAL